MPKKKIAKPEENTKTAVISVNGGTVAIPPRKASKDKFKGVKDKIVTDEHWLYERQPDGSFIRIQYRGLS